MMIRTLQVLRRFVFSEWGGTETVVYNTARHLQETGNPAEILATMALEQTVEETRGAIKIRRFPYIYPYLNLNRKNKYIIDKKGGDPYSWSLYRYMLQAESIDLIHCHTMNRLAAIVRLAALKRDIPYLVSFHGGFFDVPVHEMSQMVRAYKGSINYGKIIDILIRKSRYLEDAAAIICVGYNEYEITKTKFPDKLVYYLPNGVEPAKFKPCQSNDFRERHQISPNAGLILCISRLDYQKNQHLLIELLEKLVKRGENAHLALIGPITSEKYYQKMMEMILEKGLGEKTTIIPGLQAEDADLVKAYQAADVFILPSIHEPFGIVVLEAWASGLPVIAAGVGGLKRLVRDGENGLVFDGSIKDLEEKYLRLAHNSDLVRRLINRARDEVLSDYSWRTVTEKLTGYYHEILERHRMRS
jgi:glycosyltransferase involved in cell wall biosynthesis